MLCSKALFVYDDAENPRVQTVIAFAQVHNIALEQLSIQSFLQQPGRPQPAVVLLL